ncbi:MAG TPA: DUF4293 domain-containing protein [Bacteroidales bacterium]|nr:DUF4293 domain-containing protein [Bacteroidales bacterium]
MLQRIQSLYLTLVAILSILIYFFPFAAYPKETIITLYLTNINQLLASATFLMYIIIILNVAILALSLITIFKYKNRILQMRLNAFNFLFNALLLIGIYWLTEKAAKEYETFSHYKLGSLLPFIMMLLIFLANKNIKKDEEKVRAADRLR